MLAREAVKRREGDNLQFTVHSLRDVELAEHVLVEGVIDVTADPSQRLNAAFKFVGKLLKDHHAGTIVLSFEEDLVRTAPLGCIVAPADAAPGTREAFWVQP